MSAGEAESVISTEIQSTPVEKVRRKYESTEKRVAAFKKCIEARKFKVAERRSYRQQYGDEKYFEKYPRKLKKIAAV
jgi:hypothetical protein